MRVALVYDRLNKIGGAERVLTSLAQLYPSADWYTSTFNPAKAPFARGWRVKSSFLSTLTYFRDHHELLPLIMPNIFESFDLSSYDLVISIGSAEAKGVITRPTTLHLHYCLTPTRYLYSHAHEYLNNPLYQLLAKPLRAWDQVASTRPDVMIAISEQVKKRIQKYYNRDSAVIYPPVDTKIFSDPPTRPHRDSLPPRLAALPKKYFLVVSRLVPYKRLDYLLKVFADLPKQNLVIVGQGSQSDKLRNSASPNILFFGHVKDAALPTLYANATAYLQGNEEDFGISMVEAQASGTPVIAYGFGGAAEIVKHTVTGLLIPNHNLTTWVETIDKFDPSLFDKEACRQNALRFDTEVWKAKLTERINRHVNQK